MNLADWTVLKVVLCKFSEVKESLSSKIKFLNRNQNLYSIVYSFSVRDKLRSMPLQYPVIVNL